MTLYDHITAYMFGIWVICALMDVTIVAGSMFYANRRLNRKYIIGNFNLIMRLVNQIVWHPHFDL